MCIGTRALAHVYWYAAFRDHNLHCGIRHSFRFKVKLQNAHRSRHKRIASSLLFSKMPTTMPATKNQKNNCLRLASTVVLQCAPVENKNTKRTYTCHSLSNSCAVPPPSSSLSTTYTISKELPFCIYESTPTNYCIPLLMLLLKFTSGFKYKLPT